MSINGGEVRLRVSAKAEHGRDVYRRIREDINRLRALNVEPKVVWAGQDTYDAIQTLWDEVSVRRDRKVPAGVAMVPMRLGAGLGRSAYTFEYWPKDERAVMLAKLRPATDNPLPFND